jgi:hypothetical protein
MSTKTASLAAGLTALGCLAFSAAWTVADGPAPAAEPPPSVLLLADGSVVRGTILETDDGYIVRTPIGQKLYRRRVVERTFGSLEEIYAYKLERLPARDPDERLRLAKWCLAQKLLPEAREQLAAILAAEPEHPRAQAMLFQIDAALARRTAPADAAVQRTAVEPIEPPAALKLNELRDAARKARTVGPPVIFDLPPALAIKRYNDFQAYIHRDLQQTCVKCHHEQSDLAFQMTQARSTRDYNNDLLVRANLDAVLRLVDRQDPSRSRLLGAAIMPHKPDERPILHGANHPTYRRLEMWVAGLKSPTAPPAGPGPAPGDGVVPAALRAPAPRPNTGFAADRRGSAPTAPPPLPAQTPAGPSASVVPPPADLAAPHSIRLDSGETVPFEPAPAGQILPGSTVGMPKTPPATVPPPRVAVPRAPGSPADPTATEKPAPKTITVPGIGEVEVVDLDAPTEKEAAAKKAGKKDGINKDALQKFITGGRK